MGGVAPRTRCTSPLTDAEVDARLPVWCALSELFVDTAFDDTAADAVARVLRDSGLPLAELDRILRDDVAPVFHRNAFAGHWTGWAPAEVRRAVMAHLAAADRPVARLVRPLAPLLHRLRMGGFSVAWAQVRARLQEPAAPPR